MKIRALSLAAAFVLTTGAQSAPEPEPSVKVCLERYSSGSKQARYRVMINWNGFKSPYKRIDLAAEDANHDIWPQFRDERLSPDGEIYQDQFVVSDVSRYPLYIYLLGFSAKAADEFDEECRQGFCSLRRPLTNVTIFGAKDSEPINSVAEAGKCEDRDG